MRIAIVTSTSPFIRGGAENLAAWLGDALRDAGHEVDTVALPFNESPERLAAQLAMFRMIDLTDQADIAVCLRPPAHLVRHPRKVVWFIHHLRGYFDLWDADRGYPNRALTRAERQLLRRADARALAEARRVLTNSATVARRLLDYDDVAAEVVYPPLPASYPARDGALGDEIVMLGRLVDHKRPLLLIEALGRTASSVRLRFVGAGHDPRYAELLRTRAAELGVADRVTLENRWVSEPDKLEVLDGALAGAYLALDEDSYGYATLEYAMARRPVLTTRDSGGVLEFVRDGVEGLVADPDPGDLAVAMDRLYTERERSRAMGEAAFARLAELRISWDRVVERIVA